MIISIIACCLQESREFLILYHAWLTMFWKINPAVIDAKKKLILYLSRNKVQSDGRLLL